MTTASQANQEIQAPPEVRDALERLTTELIEAAGENLLGIALFGGLARGSFHRGFSDINLAVLLGDASITRLAAIAPALQRGFRATRAEPLILTPRDLAQFADAFPTKLLDMREHHRMLHGQDFLDQVQVSPDHIRIRIKQGLSNLLLRLRRRYVAIVNDPAALTLALARAARPLAIDLDGLLRLAGRSRPADSHTASIFAEAASAFGLDSMALAQLALLRHDQTPPNEVAVLLEQVLAAIAKAVDTVDTLGGATK